MAKKFSDLSKQMTDEARKRVEFEVQRMLEDVALNKISHARSLSQKLLTEILNVPLTSITELEKRTDMYLSTLRSHIEAMGGELEVVVRFPDGAIKISNFSDLGNAATV